MDDFDTEDADSLLKEMKAHLDRPIKKKSPVVHKQGKNINPALALVNTLRNDLRSLGGLDTVSLEAPGDLAKRKKKKPRRKMEVPESVVKEERLKPRMEISELIEKKLESEPLIVPIEKADKPMPKVKSKITKRKVRRVVTHKKRSITTKKTPKKTLKKKKKLAKKVIKVKSKTTKKKPLKKRKVSGREKLLMLLAKKRKR